MSLLMMVVLIMLRALNSQSFKNEPIQQKENIFDTRYNFNNKACNVIVDSGSCTNVTMLT